MGQYGIGQGIKRVEDVRLLRGRGRYLDDVSLPGQAHAVILRSQHAHARIRAIDSAAALRAPGVLAVFTGADVEGLGTMTMTLKRKRPDGSPMFARPHRGLSRDRARYVGDPVALVVAETRAQAEDAADLVQIDYEPLPSVTATADATVSGAAPVWDECPDNISSIFESGDRAATEAVFARAHRIVRRRYVITRVHAQFMEPRGSLGVYDPYEDRYTLYADVQYPHRVRNALAGNIFKVPEHKIRVVAGDIGGALRHQGLAIPRAQAGAVGGAQAGAAGALAVRAARGHPGRRARTRQRERGRAGARRRGPVPRHARPHARERRGVRLLGSEPARDVQQRDHPGRRLQVRGRLRARDVRHDQHELDGPVPRRRAAGGDVRPGAADRRRRPRARRRSGRAPAQESDPDLRHAVQEPARRHLRLRRFSGEHGKRPQARRRRRLRGAARGVAPARQAARPGHRQPDRAGGRAPARVRRDPIRAERERDRADGLEEPGPGPRDHLQADPQRAARPRSRGRALRRRRHGPGGVRAWARWARGRP